MKRVSVKFECNTCRAIFTSSFSDGEQNHVKCPECGRKKLTIKKTKMLDMVISDDVINKLNEERKNEISDAHNSNETIVTHERDPIHREEIQNIPTFQCVNCILKFDFDIEKGDPSCPKCGSAEVVALRPKVRFISVPDPIILTKSERKKIHFIRSGYRNFKKIEQGGDGLINILVRSGVSEKRIDLFKKQIRLVLKELEASQDLKLKEYDKLIELKKT